MSILADYHVHSSFSADSDTPMELQILSGIEKGLRAMCFTEHVDPDYPYCNTPKDEHSMPFVADHASYFSQFCKMKEKYADRIHLFYGIELGLNANSPERISAVLSTKENFSSLDFVLGSTHSASGYDPYFSSYFEIPNAVSQYFEQALRNVETFSDFDSYGHLDYVLRYARALESAEFLQDLENRQISYGTYCYYQNQTVIDQILKILVEKNIALEVNTQALKKNYPETNPSLEVIKRYKQLGGEYVTIGSDAHTPDFVGENFEVAKNALALAGFDHYTIFVERKPYLCPMDDTRFPLIP